MRLVGISLAAVGLFSLALSLVIANAVLGPFHHHHGKPVIAVGEWTTTVFKE